MHLLRVLKFVTTILWYVYCVCGICPLVIFLVAELLLDFNTQVQETPVKRLCKTVNVITVNGQLPGPTLEANNGDTLVIKVTNKAQYNITIHW